MSNTLFILGAGASRGAGAPLMADFLDIASDLLRLNKLGSTAKKHFQEVFSTIGDLQSVHSKGTLDLNNIESVFTAFELGRVINRIPGVETDQIQSVVDALKYLIVSTIEKTMAFPVYSGQIHPPASYGSFAQLVQDLLTRANPKETVSVLTFNYDIGIDVGLARAGLATNYHLDQQSSPNNAVDLLKLHGSLNWATEEGTNKVHPIPLRHYLARYTSRALDGKSLVPISEQLIEYFSKFSQPLVKVDSQPVIVPPSWNKSDYHKAISNVWARAAEHLSEAVNIFVIGYSLPETDAFFRHLYALGSVGDFPIRRFSVFNPDQSGNVEMRFRAMLGPGSEARFEYHPVTFDQSISEIRKYFTFSS